MLLVNKSALSPAHTHCTLTNRKIKFCYVSRVSVYLILCLQSILQSQHQLFMGNKTPWYVQYQEIQGATSLVIASIRLTTCTRHPCAPTMISTHVHKQTPSKLVTRKVKTITKTLQDCEAHAWKVLVFISCITIWCTSTKMSKLLKSNSTPSKWMHKERRKSQGPVHAPHFCRHTVKVAFSTAHFIKGTQTFVAAAITLPIFHKIMG